MDGLQFSQSPRLMACLTVGSLASQRRWSIEVSSAPLTKPDASEPLKPRPEDEAAETSTPNASRRDSTISHFYVRYDTYNYIHISYIYVYTYTYILCMYIYLCRTLTGSFCTSRAHLAVSHRRSPRRWTGRLGVPFTAGRSKPVFSQWRAGWRAGF